MGVTKAQAQASQATAAKKEKAAQASGQTAGGSPVGETSAQKASRLSGSVPSGQAPSGQSEAQKQAEIHGITKEGKFTRSLSQQEFQSLSSELQTEYNRQAQESQRQQAEEVRTKEAKEKQIQKQQAEEVRTKEAKEKQTGYPVRRVGSALVPEELFSGGAYADARTEPEPKYTKQGKLQTYEPTPSEKEIQGEEQRLKFAREYEAEKGLAVGGERLLSIPSTTLEADIKKYEGLVKQFESTGSTDEKLYKELSGLYEKVNLAIEAENIARQKKYEEDLTKHAIGIVTEAKSKGASKIQIYTPEGKPIGALGVSGAEEPLKYLLRGKEGFSYAFTIPKTTEEKAEQVKAKEETKQFKAYLAEYQKIGTTFDITKNGQLVGVTSKEHPYYDILKAQKEHGEVSISPTKRLLITGERQPEPPSGTVEKARLAIPTAFYNLGVLAYYAPESIREAIGNIQKEAKSPIDIFTKGYSPETTRKTEVYSLPDPTIEYLTTGKTKGTPQERDIYLASNIALLAMGAGRGRRAGAEPGWVGFDLAKKPIQVVKPRTLTPTFTKPSNMFREPLPKEIFKFDTAKTPTGSATPKRPMEPVFESGADAIAKAKKSSEILLEPIPPKIEVQPKPLEPKFTEIFETGGRPPIKREPTFEVFGTKQPLEEPLPRAEAVELTKVLPSHEIFSAKGKPLGIVGEAGPPIGALGKIQRVKPTEPPLPEDINPLGRKGRPPIQRATLGELPPSRAKKVELEGILYSKKGVGALGKHDKKLGPVKEEKGYKPDIKEYVERLGPDFKVKKIDTDRLLGIEKPRPKGFAESAFRSFIERTRPATKEVQEVKGYKPDIKDFYSQLSRTKPPKKGGKIDTTRLLDIETPTIGEPKSFTESLVKLNVKKLEKTKPTKESEKAFRSFARRFEEPKPEGKQIPTKSGQILVQQAKTEQEVKTKLATKPAVKKREPKLATQTLVTTQYQEEETYLHRNRPRPATRTVLITSQKIESIEKLDSRIRAGLGTKTGIKEIQKPAVNILTLTETTLTPKEKQKQQPKLIPRFAYEMPTPLRPKIKQTLGQPQAQKQPQKQSLLEIPRPKPPRLPIIFAWPSGRRKTSKPKPEKPGVRADFLGNVRVSNIEGIYKRSETTYGQKRINKLLREDKPKGKKFVKGSNRSFLEKTHHNIITRPKKKGRLRL